MEQHCIVWIPDSSSENWVTFENIGRYWGVLSIRDPLLTVWRLTKKNVHLNQSYFPLLHGEFFCYIGVLVLGSSSQWIVNMFIGKFEPLSLQFLLDEFDKGPSGRLFNGHWNFLFPVTFSDVSVCLQTMSCLSCLGSSLQQPPSYQILIWTDIIQGPLQLSEKLQCSARVCEVCGTLEPYKLSLSCGTEAYHHVEGKRIFSGRTSD